MRARSRSTARRAGRRESKRCARREGKVIEAMAPVFKTAPTPKQFATAWAQQFETAVKKAAGKDGRLTITEARRIAEQVDGSGVFADNAVNYLTAKKQKSVSPLMPVDAGKKYALQKA